MYHYNSGPALKLMRYDHNALQRAPDKPVFDQRNAAASEKR